MKTVKNITCGIAICLAVLITIYLLTAFVKFKPDEGDVLEDGTVEEVDGAIEQFLDSNIKYEEHLNLIILLLISAAVGLALEKLPSLGVISSAVALCYALTLLRLDELDKYPMTIVILTLTHTAGAMIYAATATVDEQKRRPLFSPASSAAVLLSTGALAVGSYVVFLQHQATKTAEYVEIMAQDILTISPRLTTIPHVIESAYRVFTMHGAEEARMVLVTSLNEFEAGTLRAELANTINADEMTTYLKLVIILLATIVFSLVLRRFSRIVAAISFIPPLYAFLSLMNDSFTSATLVLLTLTTAAAICAFSAIGHKERASLVDADGNELPFDEWDEDEEHIDDDDHDSDTVSDEEAEGLDFFIGGGATKTDDPKSTPAVGTPEYESFVDITPTNGEE